MRRVPTLVIGAVLLALPAVAGATHAGAQTPGLTGTQATPFPSGATATPGLRGPQATATPLGTRATSTPIGSQLTPGITSTPTPGVVGTLAPTGTQNLPLTATLIGGAEVPGPGDPDGLGSAAILFDAARGAVCYALHVVNIDPPTGAHIHEGAVGEAGPVVVPLTTPADGNSSGCVQDVEQGPLSRLMQNPAGFYVNVHNSDYPEGAVRGQLGR